MRTISHSEMITFQRCAREHKHKYIDGRVPEETSEPLRFGSLMHRALEAWWTGKDWKAACEGEVTALALMTGYDIRWQGHRYETIAAESTFRAPITNPDTGCQSRTFELTGVLDVVAWDRATGEKVLVEHKTTSEEIGIASAYWRRVTALDPQVSTYHIGARALGHDVARCEYDVIRKPGIRRLKATPEASRKRTKAGDLYAGQRVDDESDDDLLVRLLADIADRPDRYYARGPIVRLAHDEREHARDIWHLTRLIRESETMDRAPRNPQSCVRYGQQCPYFGVCAGEQRIEDFAMREKKETNHVSAV